MRRVALRVQSVDDEDVEEGWTFDETTNSVIFDRDAAPEAGSIIEVEYEARCFP